MRAKLAEDIQALANSIIEANEAGDDQAEGQAYEQLKHLCYTNRNSNKNHPLQWEALGDFSASLPEAVAAYEEGLVLAQKFKMHDSVAALYLALAEAYYHNSDLDLARQRIESAEAAAKHCEDFQLKGAINELRDEIQRSS